MATILSFLLAKRNKFNPPGWKKGDSLRLNRDAFFSRVKTLSEVALRALIAATLACLMTACIAGAFYNKGIILFSAVL